MEVATPKHYQYKSTVNIIFFDLLFDQDPFIKLTTSAENYYIYNCISTDTRNSLRKDNYEKFEINSKS